MGNARIMGIEICHPSKLVDNEELVQSFVEQGKDRKLIDEYLRFIRRNERYFSAGPEENTLTMGIKAAQKVFDSLNITGEDIDLFVFSTQTPEYLLPTNAMAAYEALHINPHAQCFDQNCNCLGMLTAASTINDTMRSNPRIKKALLIGSDTFSEITREDNELSRTAFGDMACAVVFENTEEDAGIIDVEFYNNGERAMDFVKQPSVGYYKSFNADKLDRQMFWLPFGTKFVPEIVKQSNDRLTERCGISVSSTDWFCYSQFAYGLLKKSAEALDVSFDKFLFSADKYGYTATCSPFVAMYEGIKDGKIKRGDMINMWSLGVFWTTAVLYMRY